MALLKATDKKITPGRGRNVGHCRHQHCYSVIYVTSVILLLNSIIITLAVPVSVDSDNANFANSLRNIPGLKFDKDAGNGTVKVNPMSNGNSLRSSANNVKFATDSRDTHIISEYLESQEIEYKVSLILRCAAVGQNKPNVTWLYYGKPLPEEFNLLIKSRESYAAPEQSSIIKRLIDIYHNQTNSRELMSRNLMKNKNDSDVNTSKSNESNDLRNPTATELPKNEEINPDFVNWVDFKLPKLNMALYGELQCQADGQDGISIRRNFHLIHNANSSVFMKLVRTTAATVLLLMAAFAYRYCLWYGKQRKQRRYAKLPEDDYKTIKVFKKGLTALAEDKGLQIAQNKFYPTTMTAETTLTLDITSFNNTTIGINSWLDFEYYEVKKEILKENFKIEFDSKPEDCQWGTILPGKFRCPKNMKFDKAAVKVRSQRRGESFCKPPLEEILKELKALASLPEENFCIRNLKAAFTQKLYNCEVYLLLDHCEHGTLARYIDINKLKFRDLSGNTNFVSAEIKSNGVIMNGIGNGFHFHDENQNSPKLPPHNRKMWTFSTEELVVWAAEIADGMKFLHKYNIVHGNLNICNVYLTDELIAKVGNIGYTPKISALSSYPPECRYHTEYSSKSDIWLFGMTLFEMFSLRSQYRPSEQNIIDHFALGEILVQPKYAIRDIQTLMENCWNPEHNFRPEFKNISDSLRQILQQEF